MQCEKQKTTNKYKGKEHHQSSSVKYIRMGVQFSQFKWVRPTALYPVQKHMHLSRIGFLNIFEVHVQKTQKLDFDRLECPGNRPMCVCVCVSFGKARTFTDLLRMCLCSEQTCIDYSSTHKGNNHRKEEGRRHLEDFENKRKTK